MSLSFISKKKLTLLRKLGRKKYRQKEQLFLVEGARAVQQLIENKQIAVEGLFFDENQQYWQQPFWSNILDLYSTALVSSKDFATIADTDNPQGLLALCQIPVPIDVEVLSQKKGIILATDRLQDPGNMGTIIRTASWFGAAGLLCGKGSVDLFHPKVVRSTAGATGSIAYQQINLTEALSQLESEGWQVVLLDAGKQAVDMHDFNKTDKMVIVTGNEAHGVDKALHAPHRPCLRISSSSASRNVESLNAAIATSIALYALT